MSDIWSASCLMGLLCAQLMLTGGPSTLLYSLHHHCYDYRAAYLNPHMIHKTLKNKTLKMIKKAPEQIIPPVIIGYWIFTQRKTKQHILEDSPKTNKTGNFVFTPKSHRHKSKKRSLTFTHMITPLPAPRKYWWSTANTASPMINECERVQRRVLDRACRRERSTEPMTTTMHGWNRVVEERHTTLTQKKMPWVSMVVSSPNLCRHIA